MSWAASSIDGIMQLGWGAALFTGLAALCVFIFFLSLAAMAWRIFKPLPDSPLGTENSKVSTANTANIIGSDQFDAFEKKTNEAIRLFASVMGDNGSHIAEIRGAISRLDAQINDLHGRLKPDPMEATPLARLGMPDKPAPKDKFDSIDIKISGVRDYFEERSDGLRRAIEDLKKTVSSLSENQKDALDYTVDMFRAERTMEKYKSMSLGLAIISDRLDNPLTKTNLYPSWREWTLDYGRFTSVIRDICRILLPYMDLEGDIFDTPSEKYKSQNWTFDFGNMDDDQKHDYKTYRIILSNFETAKRNIESELNRNLYINL